MESRAPAAHQRAARGKRRSIVATVAAERIIAVKMKPCSRANAPWIQVSLRAKASTSVGEKGGPPGTPTPAARSPVLAMRVPQAPTPGRMPITTAGAWARGVAWNACAVITIPIQSTMAMPALTGTAQAMCASVPVRQMIVAKAPFSTEYPARAHRLPARVADVDGGGKAGPERGGHDASEAVHRQRRGGGKRVARGLRAPD